MLLGYREYEITGDGYQKLYRLIVSNKIPVRNMHEEKDILYLRLSAEYCKKFEKICSENGYNAQRKKAKGLVRFPKFARSRPGLIIGFVVVCAAMIYFSNIAVSIKVLNDNDVIKEKVITVLKDNGISAGTYIPGINYSVVERELRQSIDEISWAGITRKGSVLMVDVVENIDKPKSRKERLPSSLIASEDAVIDKLEVLDGQVKLGVGCGVCKGDTIVSGEVVTSKSSWVDGKEKIDTKTTYTRSIGKVYGTFERTVTFEQPMEDRQETLTGKTENLRTVNFFSAKIPLFFSAPKGYYKSQSSTVPINLLGIELPISVTNSRLEEYDFKATKFMEDECKEILEKKVYKYEQNFLKDYEIKDRQTEIQTEKNTVRETVTYKLYGVISKEVEFFINK